MIYVGAERFPSKSVTKSLLLSMGGTNFFLILVGQEDFCPLQDVGVTVVKVCYCRAGLSSWEKESLQSLQLLICVGFPLSPYLSSGLPLH